jgi:hypothetical protein
MKAHRRNTRRRASRMAELQIQSELAREQMEALERLDGLMQTLPSNEDRIVMLEPEAIPRAVRRAFEAIEAEAMKSNTNGKSRSK